MIPLVNEIYQSRRVVTESGDSVELSAEIPPEAGLLLYALIKQNNHVAKTLEVGCANGLSSLHICAGIAGRAGAHHTMIDPVQRSRWLNVGVSNLKRAGFDFFHLIEDFSEFALPTLLRYYAESFDFIFIDGWHTFDHSLVDSFFANRLLAVGGILALDDANWTSVNRTARWLQTYPCYKRVGTTASGRVVALQKIEKDNRPWNWDAQSF